MSLWAVLVTRPWPGPEGTSGLSEWHTAHCSHSVNKSRAVQGPSIPTATLGGLGPGRSPLLQMSIVRLVRLGPAWSRGVLGELGQLGR